MAPGCWILPVRKGESLKEGIDVVTGATQPSVIRLFESICKAKTAPMWRLGKDFRYRTTGSGLHYSGLNRQFNGLRLGLKGKFQSRNGALALAAIERLEEKGIEVSSRNIREGLEEKHLARKNAGCGQKSHHHT